MDALEAIIKRRAEIAKKIAKLTHLVNEDKELEVAQRVLERISGVKDESFVNEANPVPAPGAETAIYRVLDLMGSMDVDELQKYVKNLTNDSYKSILSRMKRKGLIDRDGQIISIKQNANNAFEEDAPPF